jgi:hypothetical protein
MGTFAERKRQDPKEGFLNETEKKTSETKTKIRMETTG